MLLTVTTPGRGRRPQQREQMTGQREVTEMVRAELQFEPVLGGLPLRRRHHTGVVDQHVDRSAFGDEVFTKGGNAFQRGEVHLLERQLGGRIRLGDLGRSGVPLFDAAHGHHHVGTRSRQRAGQTEPEATVGSGHDREPAGQVGDFQRQLVAHQVTGSS
jgi:hypothetical protein